MFWIRPNSQLPMHLAKRLLITPGEPAGIGPDITIQIAQQAWPAELIVIADPDLLLQRAKQLGLPLSLIPCDINAPAQNHQPSTLKILPVKLQGDVIAGVANHAHASYVIDTLSLATKLCLEKKAQAVVTGPVNKSIINQAGIPFTGHTEFFAHACHVKQTIMLFVVDQLKVALATTHLPLSDVPAAITKDSLLATLTLFHAELQQKFALASPRILVCGLNPHAGEGGYLGREDIDIIAPAINELRAQGKQVTGPLPADTIFTPHQLQQADAVLAMYHDQALPLVKYIGFGNAVNVTLGLPFVRTSVDHGTAFDIAGTGKAESSSLAAAITLAIQLAK